MNRLQRSLNSIDSLMPRVLKQKCDTYYAVRKCLNLPEFVQPAGEAEELMAIISQ